MDKSLKKRMFAFLSSFAACVLLLSPLQARAVNWWQVGWIALNTAIDKAVNLDGESGNDQYSAYLVSPSIRFNSGSNGGEFYMRPQVTGRVSSFEMHAHRANPVDFSAKITIALSTATGRRVVNKTVGSNQYVSYTRRTSDGTGVWDARFTENSKQNWQCYYRHYYRSTRTLSANDRDPQTGLMLHYSSDGYVYRYNPLALTKETHDNGSKLNMEELNNQFIDTFTGWSVDYLRDYDNNDILYFNDVLQDIEYDRDMDITTLYFKLGDSDIPWRFSGDLTTRYNKGDQVSLKFTVVDTSYYQNIHFESLNYFVDSDIESSRYPSIEDYQ